jgi:hypothetical protein
MLVLVPSKGRISGTKRCQGQSKMLNYGGLGPYEDLIQVPL